jgi:hypothetical protein
MFILTRDASGRQAFLTVSQMGRAEWTYDREDATQYPTFDDAARAIDTLGINPMGVRIILAA